MGASRSLPSVVCANLVPRTRKRLGAGWIGIVIAVLSTISNKVIAGRDVGKKKASPARIHSYIRQALLLISGL